MLEEKNNFNAESNTDKPGVFWFLNRMVFIYALIALICVFVIDWPHLIERYKVRVLNQMRPQFGELAIFTKNPHPITKEDFKEYFRYFHTVEKFVGNEPMNFNVLGYLHYYLGDLHKAKEYFIKAIYLESRFVWPFFNLGRIHFDQGEYKEAALAFEKGVAIEQSSNLDFFYSSIIYRQLVIGSGDFDYIFEDELNKAYDEAYLMILESYARLEKSQTMLTVGKYILANRSHLKERPEFLYLIGKGHFLEGQYEQAAHFIKSALDKGLNDSDAFLFLSKTAYKLGRQQEAELLLKQSILLRSQDEPSDQPSWLLNVDIF